MALLSKHTHYNYNFGESFSRRKVFYFNDAGVAQCRSTKDEILIGGGQDYCIFVTKQLIKYAASRPSLYQSPEVIQANEQLKAPSKLFITTENLNKVFDFTVQLDLNSDFAASTSTSELEPRAAKRIKVQLSSEISKNELFTSTLREILDLDEVVIDSGYIDDTPPLYSPFHRSRADLYMYHRKNYCTQGRISRVACVTSEDDHNNEGDDEDGIPVTMTVGSVWEIKVSQNASKQLYANMIHIGSQMTVKALKSGEVIDLMIVYGLAVNYEKKTGNLYKLSVDFSATTTIIEKYGTYNLVDAVNIIIDLIMKQ